MPLIVTAALSNRLKPSIGLNVVQSQWRREPSAASRLHRAQAFHRIKPKRLGYCYNKALPTVGWIDGLRVVIYPNDHRPAHVHVIGGGCEAVFNLSCPDGPPELRENYGFTGGKLTRIREALAVSLNSFCAEWRTIHGLP
jgi:hypothetical protein